MNAKNIKIKKELIKTKKSILSKYRALHNENHEMTERMKERYKPILNKIDEKIKDKSEKRKEIKTERKKLSEDMNISKIISEKMKENETNNETDLDTDDGPDTDYFEASDNDDDNDNTLHDPKNIDLSFKSPTQDNTNENRAMKANEIISHYEHILSVNEGDTMYGPRRERFGNELTLGQSFLTFSTSKNTINIDEFEFPISRGLLDLIFCKHPENYDKNDLERYKDILEICCVHRKGYDPDESLRKSKSAKFKAIIEPLFNEGGSMMDSMKQETFKNNEYVYWDDPNELVDRLRLLYSSSAAGHSSHQNEIISILEELREANIIR